MIKFVFSIKDSYPHKEEYPEPIYDVDEIDFKHQIIRFSTHNKDRKFCFNICIPFEDVNIMTKE